MDAISDPWTARVVIQKASQLGVTDAAILNAIGYFIDQDPCPILVVQPTIEIGEAFSTDRLAPMLRDTPRLRNKVDKPRSRDLSNTLRRKAFNGGFVAIGGANSAATLSGRPVRVVLLDDVDRFPPSAGTEGNPLQLAIARTTAFWNRKVVINSSPGIKGISHVDGEMMQSTQEHWYLPCPGCGMMQVLSWDRIRFEDATHRCLECGGHFEKFRWLSGTGEWRAHQPNDSRGNKILTRGFYLSGLYNPWIEWDLLIQEFMRAIHANEEGDIEPLKAFRNTRLGELHDDTGQKVEIDLYRERREVYSAEIPPGVLVLTAAADPGEHQIHYEIVGWGKGRESWGIEFGVIGGDPREQDVWDLLDEAVYRRIFVTHDGKKMRVRKMALDTGYAADFCYAYARTRQPRVVAIKGEGGLGKPLIKSMNTFTKTVRTRLVILGVDSGKEEIVNRLIVPKPGPGFCHFPRLATIDPETKLFEATRGYDEEYFKGLTAERRIVKSKHGFRTYIWMKRLSQRNEPFDCRNYALAMVALPNTGINLETMPRDIWTPSREMVSTDKRFGVQGDTFTEVPSESRGPSQQNPGSRFGAQNRPIF
jgi:phage terminase large subunit GpA-like protein